MSEIGGEVARDIASIAKVLLRCRRMSKSVYIAYLFGLGVVVCGTVGSIELLMAI